ncbi:MULTISPECIES: hypothetical protein [unclassified Paenibacillus]|uniref:Uncharacterized protein n=1 Tax=Paenibacillus provencensis TaxID=441151 RepID=A0ABW3Q198_9BACL|nr:MULTISPECIES: hypothetical protein [unclassified Paenibacillus]MCM3130598.1 hypothetical protein [Paenibacillus sp. MER 78]SDX74864.1 hypothetical protein SAMN05518848_11376 [Paenibacillus sp. PDC88]SFS90016.1 hypothetical protein SAMN04488601_106196 [Paenibacillus sp. 453mf]
MGLGENTRSAIYLAFASFIFVAALSISYYLFKTVADTNEMTYTMTEQSDRSITTTLKVPTEYIVTGAEVRQSIYKIKDIGVDIVVDGVLYPKTLDTSTVNVSGINIAKNYTPTYVRDSKGILTLLRFN